VEELDYGQQLGQSKTIYHKKSIDLRKDVHSQKVSERMLFTHKKNENKIVGSKSLIIDALEQEAFKPFEFIT